MKDPLTSGSIQEKIESCRAIGNMCYENGLKIFFKYFYLLFSFILADGCNLLSNMIGINILSDTCRYACAANENEAVQLRMMTLGALHNMINSNGKR